jgi:hypothetical protein
MCRANSILGFLCRFAIVFGLLAVPWPGWPDAYAGCLRKAATAVFGSFGPKGVVRFGPIQLSGEKYDTIILVGNREKLRAPLSGVMAYSRFDSRMLAYFPTVLVVALILATGISWRRRLWALAWGLLWIHLVIALVLWLMIKWIMCVSPGLGLCEISPFWQKITLFLFGFLIHSRAWIVVVAPIWIAVTFRRSDWIEILGQEEAVAGKPAALSAG